MRVRLANVQAEARTLFLSCLPARVPDHRNAAIVYDKAFEAFGKNMPNWFNHSGNPDFDTTKENVDKFLKDKKDVLTLLHQAVTMPDHYIEIDLSRLLMFPTLDFIDRRNAARLLALDARSNAARGEIKDAMESINDIRSLATHTLQIPYLINVMIATAVDGIGTRTLENILASAQSLPRNFITLPVKTTNHYHTVLKRAFIMEEAYMLYNLSRMEDELKHDISSYLLSQDTIPMQKKNYRTNKILDSFTTQLWRVFFLPADLTSGRERMRELQKIASRPYYEIREELDKWEASIETNPGGLSTAISTPNFRPYITKTHEAESKYQLATLALATAAYQAKKGRYPVLLDNLVPDYITKIPTDPFDGKPLKVTAIEGGLVLYSVGVNGVEDGGEEYDKAAKTGDITFCLGKAYKDRRLKPAQ